MSVNTGALPACLTPGAKRAEQQADAELTHSNAGNSAENLPQLPRFECIFGYLVNKRLLE